MKQVPKLFIMGAILFSFCASAPAVAAYSGEVTVGSTSAAPGQVAAVPIYLHNNDIDIMSLTVPMKFASDDLEVDSISFAGTLLKASMSPLVMIDNENQFLRFTYYPNNTTDLITETDGLLATIYFSINVSAPEQVVEVDTVYKFELHGEYQLWTRIEFADNSGLTLFFPAFSAGAVTVLPPMDAGYDQFNLPTQLELKQNFPNPFNPSTIIAYSLPERAHVNLTIFNILGQAVETLVDETKNAGTYEISWEASSRASGIYFYRLTYQDKVLTKKMALLK